MASELPLWFGRERGTDLTSLVDWEEEAGEEGGAFVDDFAAGLLGLLAPVAIVALLLAAASLPIAGMVALVAAGSLWLAGGIASAIAVAASEEDAPIWASVFTKILIVTGKIVAFGTVVIVVLIGIAMLLGIIIGAFASDSR